MLSYVSLDENIPLSMHNPVIPKCHKLVFSCQQVSQESFRAIHMTFDANTSKNHLSQGFFSTNILVFIHFLL